MDIKTERNCINLNDQLDKLYRECLDDLRDLNIKPKRITKVSFMEITDRKVRHLGLAAVDSTTAEVSIFYGLLLPGVDWRFAKSTMLHELLHCVEGCNDHRSKWKALAKRVNEHLSYTGTPFEIATKATGAKSSAVDKAIANSSFTSVKKAPVITGTTRVTGGSAMTGSGSSPARSTTSAYRSTDWAQLHLELDKIDRKLAELNDMYDYVETITAKIDALLAEM